MYYSWQKLSPLMKELLLLLHEAFAAVRKSFTAKKGSVLRSLHRVNTQFTAMLYYARANVCLDTTGWWFCQHLSFVQTVGMKRDATWPTLPPIKSVYNTSYVGIINYLPHPLPGWTPTSSPRRQPTQLHVPCCTPRTGKSCVCVCVCVCVCARVHASVLQTLQGSTLL